jgi:hypothetical protein
VGSAHSVVPEKSRTQNKVPVSRVLWAQPGSRVCAHNAPTGLWRMQTSYRVSIAHQGGLEPMVYVAFAHLGQRLDQDGLCARAVSASVCRYTRQQGNVAQSAELASSRTKPGTSAWTVAWVTTAQTAVRVTVANQASSRTTINLDATCALLSAPISRALTVCRALLAPLAMSPWATERHVSPVRL